MDNVGATKSPHLPKDQLAVDKFCESERESFSHTGWLLVCYHVTLTDGTSISIWAILIGFGRIKINQSINEHEVGKEIL